MEMEAKLQKVISENAEIFRRKNKVFVLPSLHY